MLLSKPTRTWATGTAAHPPSSTACLQGLGRPLTSHQPQHGVCTAGIPRSFRPLTGAAPFALAGGGLEPWDDGASIIGSSSSQWPRSLGRMSHTKANALELTLPRNKSPGMADKAPSLMHRNRNSTEPDVSLPLLNKLDMQQQGAGQPTTAQEPAPPAGHGQGPAGGWFGWQYLVALCAVSVVICYADRSNISTAVLPMAQQFNWDKAFQGIVLSSFFAGYALTQVLGGQLADKIGGKRVLASGVALWSFFTLLTPEAAAAGTIPLIGARILLGVGEGVAFPSIHSLISRNVPQASQSTAVGIVTAASYVGTALAFGVSPLIISQLGWQWVFYLFAGMALLWLPLWLPVKVNNVFPKLRAASSDDGSMHAAGYGGRELASEAGSPSKPQTKGLSDPTSLSASPSLESEPFLSRGTTELMAGEGAGAAPKQFGFWGLMRRREVWAICVAQYCQSWGMYGLLNWLPTFFSEYYHVEIADLGSYTLAPYVVQGGLGLLSGVIADKMLASGWGVRPVRILLQVVGMLGPAACLMLAVSPVVGASAGLASQLITVGLGFSALTLGGVSVSHLDVAPKHAGVIFGAGNTTATLAGLICVPITGYLLQSTGSWPLVFGVIAAHYVVGSVLWWAWAGDRPLPEDEEPALTVAALPSSRV